LLILIFEDKHAVKHFLVVGPLAVCKLYALVGYDAKLFRFMLF